MPNSVRSFKTNHGGLVQLSIRKKGRASVEIFAVTGMRVWSRNYDVGQAVSTYMFLEAIMRKGNG